MNEDERYYLDEKDAAIVFHENGSFEMVLPKMSEDDVVDSNSNTFFVIALATSLRSEKVMELIHEQHKLLIDMANEGCGGCSGCHSDRPCGEEE